MDEVSVDNCPSSSQQNSQKTESEDLEQLLHSAIRSLSSEYLKVEADQGMKTNDQKFNNRAIEHSVTKSNTTAVSVKVEFIKAEHTEENTNSSCVTDTSGNSSNIEDANRSTSCCNKNGSSESSVNQTNETFHHMEESISPNAEDSCSVWVPNCISKTSQGVTKTEHCENSNTKSINSLAFLVNKKNVRMNDPKLLEDTCKVLLRRIKVNSENVVSEADRINTEICKYADDRKRERLDSDLMGSCDSGDVLSNEESISLENSDEQHSREEMCESRKKNLNLPKCSDEPHQFLSNNSVGQEISKKVTLSSSVASDVSRGENSQLLGPDVDELKTEICRMLEEINNANELVESDNNKPVEKTDNTSFISESELPLGLSLADKIALALSEQLSTLKEEPSNENMKTRTPSPLSETAQNIPQNHSSSSLKKCVSKVLRKNCIETSGATESAEGESAPLVEANMDILGTVVKSFKVSGKEKPFECGVCGRGFGKNYHLKEHTLTHTGEKPHKCNLCEKCFGRKGDLKIHLRRHSGEKPFVCDVCNKGFVDKKHLLRHLNSHKGEKPFICPICGKGFAVKCNLSSHSRMHTGERPYKCQVCLKDFSQSGNLKRHIRSHTGENPYKCAMCERSFAEHGCLKKHARTHTGERPFVCDICERAFSVNRHLIDHMRVHTGERPHSCSVCSKAFSKKGDLIAHLRRHMGEKPYLCSYCGKAFVENSHLRRHTIVHTRERPYICDTCGESFSYKPNLIKHSRKHTGEKPFMCSLCGMCFVARSTLVDHVRIHTGKKPYACQICGKAFAQKGSLLKHADVHS